MAGEIVIGIVLAEQPFPGSLEVLGALQATDMVGAEGWVGGSLR